MTVEEKIRHWMHGREDELVEALAPLIAAESTRSEAKPGMPFGEGPAMALDSRAVSIDDPALRAEPRLAIVLGTEGDGLAHSTIAHCDYTVMIPMQHGVDSLNVAAAGAVAFWELRAR